MDNSYLQQAERRHTQLISALSEFQASGDSSDRMLGAYGLVVVYDYALDCGILTVKVTIFHCEGAWIRTCVPCPGLSIDQIDQARAIARCSVIGAGE